jgi:hypothetical protein
MIASMAGVVELGLTAEIAQAAIGGVFFECNVVHDQFWLLFAKASLIGVARPDKPRLILTVNRCKPY